MQTGLEKVGLTNTSESDKSIKVYFINNSDGSARWIWNASNPSPDFLRFYSISTFRAWLFSFAIRVIFFFNLQHLIFRKKQGFVRREASHPLATFTEEHFSIFTGTPGPNRKFVVYAKGQFVKVGLSATSEELLNNECNNLQGFGSGQMVEVPSCIQLSNGVVALSDLGTKGTRNDQFTSLHAAALTELIRQKPTVELTFSATTIYQKSQQHLTEKVGESAHQIPAYLKEKLEILAQSVAQKQLTFTWAHRDFTPWNCFVSKDKIWLYDFELANAQLPFGFDAFHFVMQQGILVDRLPWHQLKPILKQSFETMKAAFGTVNESFEDLFGAYLFINTTYHINLYSQQEQWHTQVNWLFATWNDALSDLLNHQAEQRALLIGDVFDFLQNKAYAAVKFPNIQPQTLSEYADIDLLVEKETAQNLIDYISKHSLVKTFQVQSQSKMKSVLVILQNNQVLALDLIWKLKVKSLEFMNVKAAIQAAVRNDFGIKILNQEYHQAYLTGFYGLNSSLIPAKYHHSLNETPITPYELKFQVKNAPFNNGFAGLMNRLNYLIDSIRNLITQKGMVITFSGVDGAGKSTIIEHTKKDLEKKLRKEVIVIRHRPSVLPILSAITHGKEKAEQKAASTLPRQGNNQSVISSLLRFSYYYTDYLFGQYYVYVKHVLRGKVVLYDRYYFDFINDSLRSNIRLPRWFTKAGYKLLLKPNLNFFLYADADVILSRKKELDAQAITSLTHDYLSLFSELDKHSKGRYFPIENIQLNDTMAFISSKAQAQLV